MPPTSSFRPGYETNHLAQRRLSERFQRLAEIDQTRRAENARATTRQRVAEAEDVLRTNALRSSVIPTNEYIDSGGVNTPPSPRTIRVRQGAVEIPASHEYRTLNDGDNQNDHERGSFVSEDIDETERSESSMSFRTAISNPLSSSRSDTSIETVTREDTNSGNAAERNEDMGSSTNSSSLPNPQVQGLVDELKRVQEDKEALEDDLEAAKREIDSLRSQLHAQEEQLIQNPCDATASEACRNLQSHLRRTLSERDRLQIKLEEVEEREREAKRQLSQARLTVEDNENTIGRLNSELANAILDRNQHARTVAALRHQLNDFQQHQGTQAQILDNQTQALNRAVEQQERYAGYALQFLHQLQEHQNAAENSNNTTALVHHRQSTQSSRRASRTERLLRK